MTEQREDRQEVKDVFPGEALDGRAEDGRSDGVVTGW